MSISTHVNEYNNVAEFLANVSAYDGTDIPAVKKFLHGIYPDDSAKDNTEYDMDKGANDPEFKIKVIDNSMDEYYEENYLKIHLPSRDDADELAYLLNGTVTYDGTKPKKKTMTKKVVLPKFADETAETNFPYIYKVECDGDDGVRVFVFKAVHSTEKIFKYNVKSAIKDWIDSNLEDFAAAVADVGMNDLAIQPGEPGFKSAAKKSAVTWEMVVKSMPDKIALRHGFTSVITTTIWVSDEYENIPH